MYTLNILSIKNNIFWESGTCLQSFSVMCTTFAFRAREQTTDAGSGLRLYTLLTWLILWP